MNNQPEGGVVLGGVKPRMPEITIYPAAHIGIHEGGLSVGDATHHLRITLPVNGRGICIPYNERGLNALGQEVAKALGTAGASTNQ